MKYYFASSTRHDFLHEVGVQRFLLSYILSVDDAMPMIGHLDDVMVDSGAFSAWSKGTKIDVDDYINFLKGVSATWRKVALDVIPVTGSTYKDRAKCAEEGMENYLYMRDIFPDTIPVYHYGDPMRFLDEYLGYTDYIGISPANDTTESIKRAFFKECFRIFRGFSQVTDIPIKTHAFGYSSFVGCELFPFYSADSMSFIRTFVPSTKKQQVILKAQTLDYLWKKKIKLFLYWEEYITNLWLARGVDWRDSKHQQLVYP